MKNISTIINNGKWKKWLMLTSVVILCLTLLYFSSNSSVKIMSDRLLLCAIGAFLGEMVFNIIALKEEGKKREEERKNAIAEYITKLEAIEVIEQVSGIADDTFENVVKYNECQMVKILDLVLAIAKDKTVVSLSNKPPKMYMYNFEYNRVVRLQMHEYIHSCHQECFTGNYISLVENARKKKTRNEATALLDSYYECFEDNKKEWLQWLEEEQIQDKKF